MQKGERERGEINVLKDFCLKKKRKHKIYFCKVFITETMKKRRYSLQIFGLRETFKSGKKCLVSGNVYV